MIKVLRALPFLFSPALAFAGSLDVYYVPSAKLDVKIPGFGSGDDDGDGFGVRGEAPLNRSISFLGEYQTLGYDDSDVEIDQFRVGLGFLGREGSGLIAQYISADFEGEDVTGFGGHLRLAGNASDVLSLHGQIGYLLLEDDVENQEGLEYSAGAVMLLSKTTGLLLDLRKTNLEGEDSEVELEFTDIRAGVRFQF